MAYIDDGQWPFCVPYSNEWNRNAANRLASSYYGAKYLGDRWQALGAGQTAFDEMIPEMAEVSGRMSEANGFILNAYKIWKAHDSQGGAPPIPNTADIVNDGADQRAGVPVISGSQCWNLISRIVEYLAWGDTGLFDNTSQNVGVGGFTLYTIVDMSTEGRPGVVQLSDGQELLTRCNEFVSDYDANSAVKLGSVLQVAVNVSRYGY